MHLRPYQIPIFNDNTAGILGLHWARQLGKSTVLAAWAMDRLLTRPGRLVTVLSNCQQNGSEFAEKCQAICAEHGAITERDLLVKCGSAAKGCQETWSVPLRWSLEF